MSYRTLIQTQVRNAFVLLGDIPETVLYVTNNVPDYDPVGGSVVDTQINYSVEGVFTSYGALHSRDPTLVKEDYSGDLAMYVLKGDQAGELPFEPRNNDLIIRNEDKLKIVGIRSDPTSILYTLLLSRP